MANCYLNSELLIEIGAIDYEANTQPQEISRRSASARVLSRADSEILCAPRCPHRFPAPPLRAPHANPVGPPHHATSAALSVVRGAGRGRRGAAPPRSCAPPSSAASCASTPRCASRRTLGARARGWTAPLAGRGALAGRARRGPLLRVPFRGPASAPAGARRWKAPPPCFAAAPQST